MVGQKRLEGYAWSVHPAFAETIRRRNFQVGDLLYSTDQARDLGFLAPGEQALQIRNARTRGAKRHLVLDLYTNAWHRPQSIQTTADQLVAFLSSGDLTEITP